MSGYTTFSRTGLVHLDHSLHFARIAALITILCCCSCEKERSLEEEERGLFPHSGDIQHSERLEPCGELDKSERDMISRLSIDSKSLELVLQLTNQTDNDIAIAKEQLLPSVIVSVYNSDGKIIGNIPPSIPGGKLAEEYFIIEARNAIEIAFRLPVDTRLLKPGVYTVVCSYDGSGAKSLQPGVYGGNFESNVVEFTLP